MKTILKTITISFALLPLLATKPTYAYGAAGCGLGSVVITENKVVHQVIAATVNGFSANQLFGITTGTLNCKTDGITHKDKEQEIFVHLNYNSLALESAQGKGEKLETFANLLECKDAGIFANFTKKNHGFLFNTEDPSEFLTKIKSEIGKDTIVSRVCKI